MGNRRIIYIQAALVCAAVALSGCAATVPTMSPERDMSAEKFKPPNGEAHIYVTRTSTLAFAVLYQVHFDQELAGSIAPNTYLLFEVAPGEHEVAVLTQESQASKTVAVTEGENAFVDVVPKIGWAAARAELRLLEPDEGRKAVKQGDRAKVLGDAGGM